MLVCDGAACDEQGGEQRQHQGRWGVDVKPREEIVAHGEELAAQQPAAEEGEKSGGSGGGGGGVGVGVGAGKTAAEQAEDGVAERIWYRREGKRAVGE